MSSWACWALFSSAFKFTFKSHDPYKTLYRTRYWLCSSALAKKKNALEQVICKLLQQQTRWGSGTGRNTNAAAEKTVRMGIKFESSRAVRMFPVKARTRPSDDISQVGWRYFLIVARQGSQIIKVHKPHNHREAAHCCKVDGKPLFPPLHSHGM